MFSTPAAAISYLKYVDTDSSAAIGNDITYSLSYNNVAGNAYEAVLTISHLTDTVPEWYAGWFTFNFASGSNPAEIDLLLSPIGTGPWSVLASSTEVLSGGGQYKSPLDAGAAGFYLDAIAQVAVPTDPAQGAWVTGPLNTTTPLTFSFNFMTTGVLHTGEAEDGMPFKVGYYSLMTNETKWIVNQLSKPLEDSPGFPVPEPATATLILVGLAWTFGRVRKRV